MFFIFVLFVGLVHAAPQPLSQYIEHTNLNADATQADIERLCAEAMKYNFRGVCVHEKHVATASELLKNSKVKVITVVNFPHAGSSRETTAVATRNAVDSGAHEVDMVISVGDLKAGVNRGMRQLLQQKRGLRSFFESKDLQEQVKILSDSENFEILAQNNSYLKSVFDDIVSVVEAAKPRQVKVIIETALLTNIEKIVACLLSKMAKAAFVKTSTGTAKAGATVEDVVLMRLVVGDCMQIKAAGGIRDREFAEKLIQAGADTLGTSASIKICAPPSSKL